MAVPDYQSLMRPVLETVADREMHVRECQSLVADKLALSATDREQLLPSGKQTTFSNRVHWATTYMAQAGLLTRPKRGWISITARGREVMKHNKGRIDNSVLRQFDSFLAFKNRGREEGNGSGQSDLSFELDKLAKETPDERIEEAARELALALGEELLTRIIAATPTFFEHLIIDLMLAMGYGGSGSGRHLGKTSDGGVDGVINGDPLGLDIVFLQAKRYAPGNVIGVDKIREFAGSLDEKGAIKGVFVTTSHFAPQARNYAERSPKRLVLIDGQELTRLLLRHGVGVRTFQTVELKKVDEDYFNLSDH